MRSSHLYKNYLSSNSQILDICIGHYFPAPLTCKTADQSPKYQSPKSPPNRNGARSRGGKTFLFIEGTEERYAESAFKSPYLGHDSNERVAECERGGNLLCKFTKFCMKKSLRTTSNGDSR